MNCKNEINFSKLSIIKQNYSYNEEKTKLSFHSLYKSDTTKLLSRSSQSVYKAKKCRKNTVKLHYLINKNIFLLYWIL